MLQSVGVSLQGHNVQWYTDNTNVVNLIHGGSMKAGLKEVAEQIVELCSPYNVTLHPVWVPRGNNELTDYVSKLDEVDD